MAPRVKPGMPPDPITIRPIRDSDLAAVVALDARTTGESKADYWRAAFDRYVATTDQACAFAAVRGVEVVGYVMGEVRSWEFGSPPCGWVFAVNVAPVCREAGIGTELFAAADAAFRKAGVKSIRTMVARDATLLMSFFRAQGMTAGPFVELELPID